MKGEAEVWRKKAEAGRREKGRQRGKKRAEGGGEKKDGHRRKPVGEPFTENYD